MLTHVWCHAVKQQKTCQQPHFVDWAIWEHGCVMEKSVCFDQVSKHNTSHGITWNVSLLLLLLLLHVTISQLMFEQPDLPYVCSKNVVLQR